MEVGREERGISRFYSLLSFRFLNFCFVVCGTKKKDQKSAWEHGECSRVDDCDHHHGAMFCVAIRSLHFFYL